MEESNLRDFHQAVEDFRLARRQAVMQQVLARLRSESAELLSYDEVRKKLKMTGQAEQGIQEIPLDAIVGSVGRSGDYTRDFLPIKDSDKERWARVKAAFLSPTGVPPIAVYRVGNAYFVRDGNHRVSVARQLGNQTIDAYVTEVRTRVPLHADDDPEEIILKERYAIFLEKTNLDEIRPGADLKMTWPGFYSMLLEHIRSHQYFMGLDFQRDVSYEEAVGHWYDEVYMPVVALLYERGLFNEFPGRTEADLYALLADYRRELGEELGWDMDAQTAVTNLAETKSERAENVISRVAGRLIDVMIPEKLEPGPQPGLWREERLEPLVPSAIFNDILVAVGGNDEQQQALDHALTLAGRANGRLFGLFVACLIFVDLHHLLQPVQLQRDRALHGELDKVVVHERHPGLQAVGHGQLVLDHEQAVQEGLCLEIERVVDVVLRPRQRIVVGVEDIVKDVAGPDIAHLGADGVHGHDGAAPIHFVFGMDQEEPQSLEGGMATIEFEFAVDLADEHWLFPFVVATVDLVERGHHRCDCLSDS